MFDEIGALQLVILGAAAGGGFALINQIIVKIWDIFAARTTRGRQNSGLLAAVVGELMNN